MFSLSQICKKTVGKMKKNLILLSCKIVKVTVVLLYKIEVYNKTYCKNIGL